MTLQTNHLSALGAAVLFLLGGVCCDRGGDARREGGRVLARIDEAAVTEAEFKEAVARGVEKLPRIYPGTDRSDGILRHLVDEELVYLKALEEGYDKNPEANSEAFINGWFRTGDQGFYDEEGFLQITGRIKEIINKGGEKISPLEIDDAIMKHESVFQGITFPIVHNKLGEEVAAAVVLKDDHQLTEQALKEFLSKILASYKIPQTIVFLEEIPKGKTGKLQRIGLAKKLGLEK